ncbi:hypothetical protein DICSQDRAFT_146369 [Dichomitus squalens LYAD-421 SS1]|uniref:uncharacterized protein n=1 Tax=Dichomitus squalens (strain LYAD-421) TaxID=732165 RepID=UPI0004412C98|nr:uncharacterized protein DICSQDRAFT_146369 [Dichomitus squalens LYAD-421 SS1]EJF62703.1 hypothetical protein DICSQDRAFT_146369 [Dichomitus squalens LYAD-421 SS1]
MHPRLFILFAALMALLVFVAANPLPNDNVVVAKRALKQYDIKRAIAEAKKKRDDDSDDHKPKPSKVWRREAPTPSKIYERRAPAPVPSKRSA